MTSLLAEERLTRILQLLAERGPLRTTALTGALGVSSATTRRDLDTLAARGLIRKVHGGAALAETVPTTPPNQDQFYRDREQINSGGKARLARAALPLITPGQTVYLDAGTTALALALALRDAPTLLRTLRIVTHGLDVAYALNGECALYMVGGEVYGSTYSVTGPDALATVTRYGYDVFFVGCTSIHPLQGLTNSNGTEAQQKAAIMGRAHQTVLLADQSKWGLPGFASFAALGDVRAWVTDAAAPDARAAFEAAGVQVVSAQ